MGSTPPLPIPSAPPPPSQAAPADAQVVVSGTPSGSASPSGTPEPLTVTLPGVGTALSTVVAIVAPLYGLGLFVVQRKLAQGMGLDDASAWYATVLVNKSTVVIQALEALISLPSLLVAGVAFVYLGAAELNWHLSARPGRRRKVFGATSLGFAALIIASLLATATSAVYNMPPGAFVGAIAMVAFGDLLISPGGSASGGSYRVKNGVVWGLLCTYGASLLLAYYAIDVHARFLPAISIPQASSKGHPATGVLVTHADGYWYVIQAATGGARLQMVKDNSVPRLVAPPGTPIP